VDLLLAYGARHDIFTARICGDVDVVAAEVRANPALLERRSVKRNRTPLEEAIEHQKGAVVALIKDMS
jgi:hypothetical protein